jgi:1,4-alpha-glucan branching enzyme
MPRQPTDAAATLPARLAPIGPDAQRLIRGEHPDPHTILGPHSVDGGLAVTAFHPDATAVELLVDGRPPRPLTARPDGLWHVVVPLSEAPDRYALGFRFADGRVWERDDPYRFAPSLSQLDLHLINDGTHERLYDVLGAHLRTIDGTSGVAFAVWAPNARSVRIVGDFDRWDGRLLPMRRLADSGVWEIFVPGIGAGELYKFEIVGRDGDLRLKADPLAFAMQVRPETASMVWDTTAFTWSDDEWMAKRATRDPYRSPVSIYEVHLGSWMRHEDGTWLGYREAGERLAEHCSRFGFTHVEFMPLAEHPFDGSWGYQVTGYYAPTARHGTPDDLAAMIDQLHGAGIGVFLDWVPAHFPTDDFALRRFDGTPLYEHPDPRRGTHPDWGTLIFNYGRPEVRNFLVANALFWLDRYHIDGLRVDAVASMLYLDYSRKPGEWLPNEYGGNENLDAIAFLREVNERCYGRFPGVITVAEESTAFPGTSRPTYLGGIGFGFKWDMGWMHDTLDYFSKDPVHRRFHHDRLTFRALYMHTEHFVLPLSHDEVVHGKGSLLGKMPGDEWRRFANLRSLLAGMYTQPGKKLLFMGSELAPMQEWDHDKSLPWELASEPIRASFGRYLEDLGALYLRSPALWASEPDPTTFAWIDVGDIEASVISYLRRGGGEVMAVIANLTPVVRHGYRIGLPSAGPWEEVLNTDSAHYGGSNVGNLGAILAEPSSWHGQPASTHLTLPPLATLILRAAARSSGVPAA